MKPELCEYCKQVRGEGMICVECLESLGSCWCDKLDMAPGKTPCPICNPNAVIDREDLP